MSVNAQSLLETYIDPSYPLRLAAPGIYSVFPYGREEHRYDRRAIVYDAVIGSEWYNRLLWGTSREQYARFAQQAVQATNGTALLDAGCGSMVFTAPVYARATRPIIALDQSLGMLQRAQHHLQQSGARENVILLQADLFDLPFRAASIETVLCMGMLHLFADIQPVLTGFRSICQPGAKLFLSSLVQAGRGADAYVRLLATTGELAPPRRVTDIERLVRQILGSSMSCELQGNMTYCIAQKKAH